MGFWKSNWRAHDSDWLDMILSSQLVHPVLMIVMFSQKFFTPTTYITATASYGFLRKFIEMKTATVRHYDPNTHEKIRVSVLTSDKLWISGVCGIVSIYGWPFYLYNDVKKIEIKMKNLDPNWYNQNQKDYLIEYLFC